MDFLLYLLCLFGVYLLFRFILRPVMSNRVPGIDDTEPTDEVDVHPDTVSIVKKIQAVKVSKKKRKVFRVMPDKKNKCWVVTKEKKTIDSCARKTEAVASAKQVARDSKPSQLVVHKKDGTIQTEYTYGDDPKKTKG